MSHAKPAVPGWAKWVLGIIATLVTAGVVGGSATLAKHGERLAVIETRYDNLKEGQDRIENRIGDLELKIDELIRRTR